MQSSNPKKRSYISLVAFFVVFIFVQHFAAQLLGSPNTYAILQSIDYKKQENIDVAFIGNSLIGRTIDPYVVESELGVDSFNINVSDAHSHTFLALTKNLFDSHTPDTIILCIDPSEIVNGKGKAKEKPIVARSTSYLLTDPVDKFIYNAEHVLKNGNFIDEYCPWRYSSISDFQGLAKNFGVMIGLREKIYNNNDGYPFYQAVRQITQQYVGKGFYKAYGTGNVEINEPDMQRKETKEVKFNGQYCLKIKQLCEKNDCELIILTLPSHSAKQLGDQTYLNCYDAIAQFCAENDIPHFNMAYAKPELLVNLDEHYSDFYHVKEEGIATVTKSVCDVYKLHKAGVDYSEYFYTREEYLASVDFVSNTWIIADESNGSVVFSADSNYGSQVTPEYRFTLINEDETEAVVQDWSCESVLVSSSDVEPGDTVRVYARAAGAEDGSEVHYDLKHQVG